MEIIFEHFWLVFIIVIFVNAFIMRKRADSYIEINPELKSGYDKLFKNFLIFANIPWLIMGIGDLTGFTNGVFEFLMPRQLNPIVLIFHASIITLWGLGSYWIYIKDGAEFLAKHPGFLNTGEPSKTDKVNKNTVKFMWTLIVLGGIIGEILMWNMNGTTTRI